jgi:hypothetical protein
MRRRRPAANSIVADRSRLHDRARQRLVKGMTVLNRSVSSTGTFAGLCWRLVLAAALLCAALAVPASAQTGPSISVGGGLRTSFVHTAPEDADSTDAFALDDIRLYVNGSVNPHIKVMFNTDYRGSTNEVNVLDAVGRFEFSPKVNLWVGRFLPPSDRANLYGPFYAHHWATFTDGVQDGYPFIYQGRDNGIMYWGQFGIVKLSGGVFDGLSATGDDTVLSAGRVQVDFWDAEGGYYLNGTYYGDKNLLAIGAAGQVQGSDKTAGNIDFLLERKIGEKGSGGAFSIEAEWARYHNLGGYPPPTAGADYGLLDGGYVLGSYLFPKPAGAGKFELLGKFAKARYQEGLITDDNQKTSEFNLNYVIKQFDARIMFFYLDTRYDLGPDSKKFGVGFQLQM